MVAAQRLRYSRGVALLATLLAIALMTLLVADFTTSAGLGYRSVANQADGLRAYFLARSGIQVGLAVLEQSTLALAAASPGQNGGGPPPEQNSGSTPSGGNNGSTPAGRYDSLDQPWARPAPPIPVDGGLAAASIVDEERKINLNLYLNSRTHLPDQTWGPIIAQLFENIGVSPDLLPVLTDWLDPDSIESPGGAEADYYLSLTPPYEPRNGPLPTIYDLRMLKGMDDLTFSRLARFCTAVAKPQINVNTAPPEVLGALPGLNDASLVEQIVKAREAAPFRVITDLSNRVPGVQQASSQLLRLLTTQSSSFTITGEGEFAGARKRIYATFQRGAAQRSAVSFSLMAWHED